MSYERCLDTYRRLRDKHQGEPEAIARIEQFGREIAFLRTLDERTAMLQTELSIAKARASARG